ncbi:RagB/SusD family nutrient uptake outer membrane protein [Persicitalea sp.]|uniref:RagB/SusD family nutrient uptake outer membrane protein n=1 Tax=Persicitalea sp. TaxID=3100273 RepID=UPI0035933F55
MKIFRFLTLVLFVCSVTACQDDFLETLPLTAPSDKSFWKTEQDAISWINEAYRDLPGVSDHQFNGMSDDAYTTVVANGTYEPTTSLIALKWDYSTIRQCLELLARVDGVTGINPDLSKRLKGEAQFIIALRYFEMTMLYQDVPLVDKVLPLAEADIPKSDKAVVLKYALDQLEKAIPNLPVRYPSAADNGRITKGAALALKTRMMLFNGRWAEAAAAAKAVMDLNEYQLHPKFNEIFLSSFNNKTKEVILARQYAEGLDVHTLHFAYAFYLVGGNGSSLPLPDLVDSFEAKDGLPITQSPLYDPLKPFANRDPRFAQTFITPFETFAGVVYDPINNKDSKVQAKTYIYFRKYIADLVTQQRSSWVNWIIFRYADVLLMYAEGKNEASGPDESVYAALDQIRTRAGMPKVDRTRYGTQATLRDFIRNERRVELAAEGLRYYDILRWKIAEKVLNKSVVSYTIPGVLPLQKLETRVFNPAKHYVWPIPQRAIDNATKLEQNPAWK